MEDLLNDLASLGGYDPDDDLFNIEVFIEESLETNVLYRLMIPMYFLVFFVIFRQDLCGLF
jgi:hypothetical protein